MRFGVIQGDQRDICPTYGGSISHLSNQNRVSDGLSGTVPTINCCRYQISALSGLCMHLRESPFTLPSCHGNQPRWCHRQGKHKSFSLLGKSANASLGALVAMTHREKDRAVGTCDCKSSVDMIMLGLCRHPGSKPKSMGFAH